MKRYISGFQAIVGENFILICLVMVGIFCLRYLGLNTTLLFIFTVGAWWIDVKIKEFRNETNSTKYADLSFACLISYTSQLVTAVDTETIAKSTFLNLVIINCALVALWLQNIEACTGSADSNKRSFTKFLCSTASVACVIIGPQLINLIRGLQVK